VDTATDQHRPALAAILLDGGAEPVEACDAMPFGVLDAVALVILDQLAVGVTRPGGGESEVGDLGAAVGGAGFGVLADIAGENNDDLPSTSPLLLSEGPFPLTTPGLRRRETLATEREPRLAPKARSGAGSRGTRQPGPEPRGLLAVSERR
jgi:hypothetical protein